MSNFRIQNVDVGEQMTLGSNGFMVQNDLGSAIVAYEGSRKRVFMKSAASPDDSLDLFVDGSIFLRGSMSSEQSQEDILLKYPDDPPGTHRPPYMSVADEIALLKNEIAVLTEELAEAREMVDKVYYAPGNPGYLESEEHFMSYMEEESVDPLKFIDGDTDIQRCKGV